MTSNGRPAMNGQGDATEGHSSGMAAGVASAPTEVEPTAAAARPEGRRSTPVPRWEGGLRARAFGNLAPVPKPDPATAREREATPEEAQKRRIRGHDSTYRRLLALADLLAVALAVVAGIVLVGDGKVGPETAFVLLGAMVLSKTLGLYDRDGQIIAKSTLDEVPALTQLTTLCTLGVTLAAEPLFGGPLGTAQVLVLWSTMLVGLTLLRVLARAVARQVAPAERCLVLGDAACTERVRLKFASRHRLNATVVGRVPLDGQDVDGVAGSLSTLEQTLWRHDVHRVILAPTSSPNADILDTIRSVKSFGVKVSLLPRVFELVGSSVRFDDADGLILLGIPHYGLTRSSRALKRAFDLCGATLALIAFGPALLAIAVAIKLESRGGVLFRAERVGRNGEEFEMLKFRSMVEGADHRKDELVGRNEAGGGLFKIAEDPRMTRVGAFLRRASLDELPQLINVLRGQMSLVGPRPLVPEDDRHVQGWDRKRLQIQPGMTGVWQALGSSRVPMSEMVKIDYRYGAQWTLWMDVKILFRTAAHVFGRRGL